MTARKPRLIEAINEAISLIKPFTREVIKFFIDVITPKKNAAMEERMAKIPFLI